MDIRDVSFDHTRYESIDRLEWMWSRQKALMELYGRVEDKKELVDPRLIDLHSKRDQSLLKDFAYRVIEEVCEAVEAFHENDSDHVREEIADATHFMIELMILANAHVEYSGHDGLLYTHSITSQAALNGATVQNSAFNFIYAFSLAIQKLKNRTWRNNENPIDVKLFRAGLVVSWMNLFLLARELGLDHKAFFEAYYRKSEVNLFRIRSNY